MGEAIDFWRVEAIAPERLIRLRAEMKVPGKAWLQFEVHVVADFVVDGLEGIVGPFVIAALVLPYLASAPVVEQVRKERAFQNSTPATG